MKKEATVKSDSLKSMTGFGSFEEVLKTPQGTLKVMCQIRTINHRFFEWKPKISPVYLPMELDLKSMVQKEVTRGTVDFFLRREDYTSHAGQNGRAPFNPDVLRNAYEALEKECRRLKIEKKNISSAQLLEMALRCPDVFKRDSIEELDSKEEALVRKVVERSLKELAVYRLREGRALRQHMESILTTLQKKQELLVGLTREFPKAWFERLKSRVMELSQKLDVSVNESRLEQELVVMSDKADVSEELTRLATHASVLSDLLNASQAQGKKIDFYLQELHREVNTLGSKIQDPDVSLHVMELKSCIEQLKEQVQNIE